MPLPSWPGLYRVEVPSPSSIIQAHPIVNRVGMIPYCSMIEVLELHHLVYMQLREVFRGCRTSFAHAYFGRAQQLSLVANSNLGS